MKKILLILSLLLISGTISLKSALPIGLGFYQSYHSTNGTATIDINEVYISDNLYIENTYTYEFSASKSQLGFGFVLETAVANDRVFNYRLNSGMHTLNYTIGGGIYRNWRSF